MIVNYPHDAIASRYHAVQKVITFAEQRLRVLPDGRLRICRHSGKTYYYCVYPGDDINGKIIQGRDIALAKDLAQRSYLQKVLKTAREEERLLKQMLGKYPQIRVEDIYGTISPERQELVTPVFKTDEQFVQEWLSQEFRHKGFREGMPVYMTIKGERVRSKTEQITADRLAARDIPYIYEKPLRVGDMIFHPDFTILRRSDRQEVYLEHLGKLGDMIYATDAVDRLNRYHRNGIIQGDKLFLLWETGNAPFDVRTLDILIEEKFR